MSTPFEPREKQLLLEAKNIEADQIILFFG